MSEKVEAATLKAQLWKVANAERSEESIIAQEWIVNAFADERARADAAEARVGRLEAAVKEVLVLAPAFDGHTVKTLEQAARVVPGDSDLGIGVGMIADDCFALIAEFSRLRAALDARPTGSGGEG